MIKNLCLCLGSFFSLASITLASPAVVSPLIPPSCQLNIEPISCVTSSGEAREGAFVRVGENPVQQWNMSSAINVPAFEQVAIAVCHYQSRLVMNKEFRLTGNQSLLPQLVGDVGEGASVSIHIENSVNVLLDNKLVIGEELFDEAGNPAPPLFDDEPALISHVIKGKVGKHARIDVSVTDSANVTMRSHQAILHIGGGSLMEEILNRPESTGSTDAINQGCINIDVQNSANVYSTSNVPQGTLNIGGGQLENESVDYPIDHAFLDLKKWNVANASAADVNIHHGELIDESVDTLGILASTVKVYIHDSANVRAARAVIKHGELIDETVDGESIKSSDVSVTFLNSANISATESVSVFAGELIDEAIDTENIHQSAISVTFEDAANVTAPIVSVKEGELIDESIDGEQYQDTVFDIHFDASANVFSDALKIEEGELVDEVLDGEMLSDIRVNLNFDQVGNVESDQLRVSGGELIDEALDIEDHFTRSDLYIGINNSANVSGHQLDILEGELVDEIVDATAGSYSLLELSVENTANFTPSSELGSSVKITNGELMDEMLDIEETLFEFKGSLNIRSSANVKADTLVLDNAQLVDEVVDFLSMSNSQVDISLQFAASAESAKVSLFADSVLLDAVIEGDMSFDVFVTYQLLNAAMLNGKPTFFPRPF
ncbi:hypothetical protein MHO82_20385 [Vibrio sp. Of7-15]|uniref:hypothetical protein n=1 Tax=Vibrio sp. Of7-15 TaxID=2724879 RepID=UPI001EF39EFA|nr:hypothetical protein [Vibrio sp. Of7-15]MCG7499228.1 hypothetical protein [Vibrio sp. Of7-15]